MQTHTECFVGYCFWVHFSDFLFKFCLSNLALIKSWSFRFYNYNWGHKTWVFLTRAGDVTSFTACLSGFNINRNTMRQIFLSLIHYECEWNPFLIFLTQSCSPDSFPNLSLLVFESHPTSSTAPSPKLCSPLPWSLSSFVASVTLVQNRVSMQSNGHSGRRSNSSSNPP